MPEINMTWTGVIIIAAATTLLAWEIIAFVQRKRRALISTWMQKFGFYSPLGMFVLGMLAGHFWAYFPPTLDDEQVVCPHCRCQIRLKIDEVGRLSGE